MTGTVHHTPTSLADIVEIVLAVRRHNRRAAKRLLDAINQTLELLSTFPTAGPRRDELFAGLRSFPGRRYTNYVVFYRPESEGIVVIRVMHGARDLPRQFGP